MPDIRKKRDRAPGRSGRPQSGILATRLTREETAIVRAICRQRDIAVMRWLAEAARAYLATINPSDYSRENITPPPDHLPGAGASPRIDHERRRERAEIDARRSVNGDAPDAIGHDHPANIR